MYTLKNKTNCVWKKMPE